MYTSSECSVSVRGLTKTFYSRKRTPTCAVDNISFDVYPGEIFGLVGINGAGKTTTLRMLSTVIRPTLGDALVYGWSVKKNSAHVRRSVGFLSQATSCYDRLSVREMVTYFARLNGMSSIRICKRVEQVFEQFDMCDFADVRCDKLSSGMRQKVSVARSVIHDPPVMIFDEPTAGLDIIASSTVVNFVQDCRTQGKCVLLSTHNMEEVEKLCNRVGIIHKGKLLCCESIDKLRARTSTTRVEDAFLELIKGSST